MQKENPSLYACGIRSGWNKSTVWPNPKRTKYTREEWDEAVRFYGYSSAMMEGNLSLYVYGCRRGWHLSTVWPNRKYRKHTKEEWDKMVQIYGSPSNMKEHDGSLYQCGRKRGWNESTVWPRPKPSPFNDRINYIYLYRFEKQNTIYVGETYHGSNRHNEHKMRGPVFEFASKNNLEIPNPIILEDGLNRLEEVREREDYWKNYYISLGYHALNKGKTGKFSGSLGGNRRKWTREKCLEVALMCSSTWQLRKKSPSAYSAAQKNNWIKDYEWFVGVGGTPKPVLQYTKDGRLVRRWDSAYSAARGLSCNHNGIRQCCKGQLKSAYGYVWKYEEP